MISMLDVNILAPLGGRPRWDVSLDGTIADARSGRNCSRGRHSDVAAPLFGRLRSVKRGRGHRCLSNRFTTPASEEGVDEVKVVINHWRNVERQQLRDAKTSDDRDAEGLTQFRACA